METSLPHPRFAPALAGIFRIGWKPTLDAPIGWTDIIAVSALVAGLGVLSMHVCCLTGQNTADFQLFMAPLCGATGH